MNTSTVQEQITGTTVANEIRLERALHSGSFLLVEGGGDFKLFKKFVDRNLCRIIVCNGKENLIDAIDKLHDEEFHGVLGIGDKDFSDLLGYPVCRGGVVWTDETDVEVMIICSSTLDGFLAEFGDESKISSVKLAENQTIADLVFEASAPIGALRYISLERGWNLDFDDMKYRFTDPNSGDCDVRRTVSHVCGRSHQRPPISLDEIMCEIEAVLENNAVKKNICCGHDCARILGRFLRQKIGNTNKFNNDEGAKLLEEIMRVGYQLEHFVVTNIFREIKEWELSSGYKVVSA